MSYQESGPWFSHPPRRRAGFFPRSFPISIGVANLSMCYPFPCLSPSAVELENLGLAPEDISRLLRQERPIAPKEKLVRGGPLSVRLARSFFFLPPIPLSLQAYTFMWAVRRLVHI